MIRCLIVAAVLLAARASCVADEVRVAVPKLQQVTLISSLDQEPQQVLYWAPENAAAQPTPVLVFLHSWSGNYLQNNDGWLAEAFRRGWIYIHPDFRGVNNTPKACGSRFARQDVLDALDFACREYQIDPQRIYLAGTSGGGHMAMLMAGHHPDRFSAVSAWVGISDLAEWHRFHTRDGKTGRYAEMIVDSLGGMPGASAEIDAEYRDRSPIHHLKNVGDLGLDLYAGVHDGHSGSVPIMHSLNAFNAVARSHGTVEVSPPEIDDLWTDGKLSTPQNSDLEGDPDLTREILLRRMSRQSRVTIFEGGHEGLPGPACLWLSRQQRMTSRGSHK